MLFNSFHFCAFFALVLLLNHSLLCTFNSILIPPKIPALVAASDLSSETPVPSVPPLTQQVDCE